MRIYTYQIRHVSSLRSLSGKENEILSNITSAYLIIFRGAYSQNLALEALKPTLHHIKSTRHPPISSLRKFNI